MKTKYNLILILILIFGSIPQINAQADRLWKEHHFSLNSNNQMHSVWVHAGFEMSSNTLNNAILNGAVFQGSIDNESTSNLQQSNSNRSRFSLGAEGQLWYKMTRKNRPSLLFGAEFQEQGIGNVETALIQLYLQGNGPYEDVLMPLGPSKISYISQQSVGFGIEWTRDQLSFGATASIVKLSRFQQLKIADGASFYTAPFGEALEANIELNWMSTATKQNKISAWYGTGLSSDIYMSYVSKDDRTSLSFQIIDLGAAHFSGINHYDVDRDTVFKGLEVNNILDFETQLGSTAGLDSLEGLIGLSQGNKSDLIMLHGRFQLDLTHRLNDNFSVAVQLRQHFFKVPPQLRLGLAANLTNWLVLEPYFTAGGFTNMNYGLSASLNADKSFGLMLNYGLLASQFYPLSSNSQHLYATAVFSF